MHGFSSHVCVCVSCTVNVCVCVCASFYFLFFMCVCVCKNAEAKRAVPFNYYCAACCLAGLFTLSGAKLEHQQRTTIAVGYVWVFFCCWWWWMCALFYVGLLSVCLSDVVLSVLVCPSLLFFFSSLLAVNTKADEFCNWWQTPNDFACRRDSLVFSRIFSECKTRDPA